MAEGKLLRLRERIEENVTIWLLGTLLTGFGAGIAAYQAVFGIANLTVIDRDAKDALNKAASDRAELQQRVATLQSTIRDQDLQLHDAAASVRALQATANGLQGAVISRNESLARPQAANNRLHQSDADRAKLTNRRDAFASELKKLSQLIAEGEKAVADQQARAGSEPVLALNREFHDTFEWEWNLKVHAVLERIDALEGTDFLREFEDTGWSGISTKTGLPQLLYKTTELRLGVLRSIQYRVT